MLVLAGGGLARVRTAVLLLAEEEGPRASSNQPFQTSGLTNTKAKLSIAFLLDCFSEYVAHLGIRTGNFSNLTTDQILTNALRDQRTYYTSHAGNVF